MAPIIAPYDPRRHHAVAAMLGRAFVDDPLYCWLWPERSRREGAVVAFVGAELCLAAGAGRVDLAVDGSGNLLGAALWALPGHYPFPLALSARVMVPLLPRLGSAAIRLPRLLRVERAHPPQPHWYLVTVGVEPSSQRHGVGRALVTARFAEADATGVPVYLETFNPANRAYYERLGFTEREAVDEPPLPPFWTFLRPAAAAPLLVATG